MRSVRLLCSVKAAVLSSRGSSSSLTCRGIFEVYMSRYMKIASPVSWIAAAYPIQLASACFPVFQESVKSDYWEPCFITHDNLN
ncbi:hypothetical protein HBH45_032890 [Parastagonospora nodorum]|nr:hypothetical protein HBH54_077860 [Parastagonospora nodorum]KAH4143320.1 hypothetical protein HBH45_032890 [Parastagonospora nodorum]KAH4579772.1 hypothetical protein HBH84_054290 [Parastagonospora nodorum]KAH4637876.1 hypothetical protein HBH55_040200 [Parastagonospora nodorum]KAH4647204.1 hypothetical protein HBH81_018890 [Parastagonospora nodorum]